MVRQAVAQHVMEIHKFKSQGVGNDSKAFFYREKALGQPRAAVKQESVQVEQQHEQQQQQQRETVPQQIDLHHSHSVQVTTVRCKSIQHLVLP